MLLTPSSGYPSSRVTNPLLSNLWTALKYPKRKFCCRNWQPKMQYFTPCSSTFNDSNTADLTQQTFFSMKRWRPSCTMPSKRPLRLRSSSRKCWQGSSPISMSHSSHSARKVMRCTGGSEFWTSSSLDWQNSSWTTLKIQTEVIVVV